MWNNGNMVASVEFSVALGYDVVGELLSSVTSVHVSEAQAICLIRSMSLCTCYTKRTKEFGAPTLTPTNQQALKQGTLLQLLPSSSTKAGELVASFFCSWTEAETQSSLQVCMQTSKQEERERNNQVQHPKTKLIPNAFRDNDTCPQVLLFVYLLMLANKHWLCSDLGFSPCLLIH